MAALRSVVTRLLSMAAVLAAMAACGKVAGLATPEGSTYPKVYPASASASASKAARTLGAPQLSGPQFTADGAYIDPSVRRVHLDPYADLQTYGAGSQVGVNRPSAGLPSAGYINSDSATANTP